MLLIQGLRLIKTLCIVRRFSFVDLEEKNHKTHFSFSLCRGHFHPWVLHPNPSFLHQKLGFLVCWIIELERKSSPLEVTNLLLSFCWFKLLEFRVLLFVFLRKILRNLVLIGFCSMKVVHEWISRMFRLRCFDFHG